MLKVVKYTSVEPVSVRSECSEKLPGCETTRSLHVCFEDGSGLTVCNSCFNSRINEGRWVTDNTVLLVS